MDTWKADCKDTEMPLQPGVNGEATSGGVHTGHILDIVDLLENQLSTVEPMLVVHVLPDECVGLDSTIFIHFRHVHIIDKVD